MHKLNEPWTANVVGRMHRYGINNNELARKCGYSPQYLSMVLNGKKSFATEEAKLNVRNVIFNGLGLLEQEVKNERLHS